VERCPKWTHVGPRTANSKFNNRRLSANFKHSVCSVCSQGYFYLQLSSAFLLMAQLEVSHHCKVFSSFMQHWLPYYPDIRYRNSVWCHHQAFPPSGSSSSPTLSGLTFCHLYKWLNLGASLPIPRMVLPWASNLLLLWESDSMNSKLFM
jgi:hypothetical protein